MPINPIISAAPGSFEGTASQIADLRRRVNSLEAVRGRADASTISSTPGPDSITGAMIQPGAITTGDIQAGAIDASLIQAGAIQAVALAANAVTAGKIAAGAVVAGNLAAGAVQAGQIVAGAISTTDLAAGAVTAQKIAGGTITATQIATDTITAGNIAAGAITSSELATGAVTAGKITAGSIVSTDIQAGQITSTLLATNTAMSDVILVRLQNATNINTTGLSAVTANLGTMTAGTVTGATVQTAASGARVVMNSGGITAYNAGGTAILNYATSTGNLTLTGTVTASAGSVVPTTVLSGTINGGTQITSGSITGDRLVIDAITTRELNVDAVYAENIKALAVEFGKVAAGAITATEISVSSLSSISANIGTITAGTLTGAIVRTASGFPRVEMDITNNALRVFMAPYKNLVTNPSIEVNTTGWTGTAAANNGLGASGATLTRENLNPAKHGSWYLKVAAPGVGVGEGASIVINQTFVAGKTYKFQFAYFSSTMDWSATLGSGSDVSAAANMPSFSGGWALNTGTWTPTTTVTSASLTFKMPFAIADTMLIDAVMVVPDELPPDYFDGSSVGAVWDGTANNSSSTMTVSSEILRADATGGLTLYPQTGTSSFFVPNERYALSWKNSVGETYAQVNAPLWGDAFYGGRGINVEGRSADIKNAPTAALTANSTVDSTRGISLSVRGGSTDTVYGTTKPTISLASGGIFGVGRTLWRNDYASNFLQMPFLQNTVLQAGPITQNVATPLDATNGTHPAQTALPAGTYLYCIGGRRATGGDTCNDLLLVRFLPAGGGSVVVVGEQSFPGFGNNIFSIAAGEFRLKVQTPASVGNTTWFGVRIPLAAGNQA